jgi:hypothetical protein
MTYPLDEDEANTINAESAQEEFDEVSEEKKELSEEIVY